MPTKDKVRGTWTGRVRLSGHPSQIKRGFPTKAAASSWERSVKRELKNPSVLGYSVTEAAELYLVSSQQRNAEHTCKWKANVIDRLLDFLGSDPPLSSITTLTLEQFLNSLPPKTANRYAREINSLFIYAIKRGIVTENPSKAIDRYKEEPYKRYVPSAEEIEAIMSVADDWDRDVIVFAYHTLARIGEIRDCTWDDVDFENGTITLWTAKRAMGEKEGDAIEMTETLKAMLKRRRKEIPDSTHVFEKYGRKLHPRAWDLIMPRLCKKAKIKPFGMHGIRHHVASLLAYRLSLIQVSKILRHKRITTTDIYLRSLVKIETKGIKVLDDLASSKSGNVVPFIKKQA